VSDKHVVRVEIVGEEYAIRSDESPEHTQKVAAHLDASIRASIKGMMAGGLVVDVQKAAILAALQITDEMLRAKESVEIAEKQMDDLSTEIRRWLPPAKRDTGEFPAI
jgi:cell division protein ZapA